MANVSVVIAMDPIYRPFERPSDPEILWSSIPRGLRGFVVQSGVIPTKPLNDTMTFALTAVLPPNYAYIFSEVGLRLTQDTMGDWSKNYILNMSNWFQGISGMSMNWSFPRIDIGRNSDGSAMAPGARDHVPKSPMWAEKETAGININISIFNTGTPESAVGGFSAFINFWEFDLEQVRKFPVNAPVPTHSR